MMSAADVLRNAHAFAMVLSDRHPNAPSVWSICRNTHVEDAAEEMLARFHAVKIDADWFISVVGFDDVGRDSDPPLAYAIVFPSCYAGEFRVLRRRAYQRRRRRKEGR